MAVTRKDIAKYTGFAPSTVGMILSGRDDNYNEETCKKVRRAAKELDYTPDMAARSLKLNRSFLIGLLLDARNTWLAAEFLGGVQSRLAGSHCLPVVFSHGNSEEQCEGLRSFMERRVDGLIANVALESDGTVDRRRYDALQERGLPIVEVFGRSLRGVASVNIDNVAATRDAVRYLAQRGHRRIALLTHDRYRLSQEEHGGRCFDAWERYLGYERAVREAGAEPLVFTHPISGEIDVQEEFVAGAAAAFEKIIAHPSAPTAVVCYSDYQAYGLIRAARVAGVALPERLSIVGYGDCEISKVTSPMLTTLRVPAREVGRRAAQVLLRRQFEEPTAEGISIASELIERESVKNLD